jgi:hypothetical protein
MRLARAAAVVLLTGLLMAVPNAAFAGDDGSAGGTGQAPSDPRNSVQLARTLGCLTPRASTTITVPGGSTANIRANGRSTVVADYIPLVGVTQAKFLNNSATVAWVGVNPFYATSVTLTENWDIDYAALSWSFSGAPSGTIGLGSGRISWSMTGGTTRGLDHAWPEVRLSVAGGFIYRTRFDVTGHFQFGSSFFRSVTGFSSHDVTTFSGVPDFWNNC